LDRFCDSLLQIRKEIRELEEGKCDPKNNVLLNSPHSLLHVTEDAWDHPYTRQEAAYPLPFLKKRKFWATVGRVDNAYGDRNLVYKIPS
jgi:glycine dehydrogenase